MIGTLYFYGGIGLLAAVTLAALVTVIGYILANGLPHIDFEFLTQEPRKMEKRGVSFRRHRYAGGYGSRHPDRDSRRHRRGDLL
jgi:hypothetical protein